jgi:hypothetical protein
MKETDREIDKLSEAINVKRMGLIKKYPPVEAKGMLLLGAMAGGEVHSDVTGLAFCAGARWGSCPPRCPSLRLHSKRVVIGGYGLTRAHAEFP